MNQLVLGASIPLAAALLVYLLRGGRAGPAWLIATPLFAAAGALWAVVPDLPRLAGRYALYHRLARDPRMDIFFWHYTIDHLERDTVWYAPVFVVLAGVLLLIAWRELRRAESKTDRA
jgi:hypothetical protein